MKKYIVAKLMNAMAVALILAAVLIIMLFPAMVFAAPTLSPSLTLTPTLTPSSSMPKTSPSPTPEILTSGSRGLVVLRLQIRLRELNYLNFAPTSSYGQMTRQAVVDFQLTNSLTSDGTVGEQTSRAIYHNDAKRAPIAGKVKLNGPSANVTTAKGEKMNWETADPLIPVGSEVKVTDYNTGAVFQLKRVGGEGCAFMETVTAADLSKLNTAFANGSWEKRPVIVEINSKRYGASLSGAPYGTSTGLSGMIGHIELFFDGSYSGILKLNDVDHQRMIAVSCF